jgi:hypothetical protein
MLLISRYPVLAAAWKVGIEMKVLPHSRKKEKMLTTYKSV